MKINKNWWAAAGVRALKTTAQAAIAGIGASTVISQINWVLVLSSAVVAGLLSLLTSIAGLPELDNCDNPETRPDSIAHTENDLEKTKTDDELKNMDGEQ